MAILKASLMLRHMQNIQQHWFLRNGGQIICHVHNILNYLKFLIKEMVHKAVHIFA